MAGVLLEQVEQDPLERRWLGTVPAGAGPADRGQVVALYHGPGASGPGPERRNELLGWLVGRDVPTAVALVPPRLGDLPTLEPPLQPAHLHEREVPDELEGCPA